MEQESTELGQQYMREKKAAQLGKRLFAKTAGSSKESRYVAYSAGSEARDGTAMECAWDSEAKHQMNRWKNVNGALHAHPMNRRRRYEKKLVRIDRS